MFGYPCAFVNGHLFCGLHLDSIIVRLPEGRRNALVARGASIFMPMPGRAMKEYVLAPADIVTDRGKLRALLGEALAHASSLAPKVKKPSGPKKKVATPKRKATPARKAAPAKKLPAKKATRRASSKEKRSG
jgi:hypothetical protein